MSDTLQQPPSLQTATWIPLRLLYLLLLPPTNNYYQYDLHHGSQLATNVACDNKSNNFFTRLLLTLLPQVILSECV